MQSDEARNALLDAILALDQQISESGVSEPELGAPIELFDIIESRIADIMGNARRGFFNKEPAELPAEIMTLNRLRNLDGYKDLFANHVFTEEEATGIIPIPSNEELSHRPLRTGALEQNGLSYNTFTTLLTLARNFDAFDKPNKLKGKTNWIATISTFMPENESHPCQKELS